MMRPTELGMMTTQGSATDRPWRNPGRVARLVGSPAVFDVFLALLFVRALALSAWRRFPAGFVVGGVGALLWLGLAVSGWYGRGADELRATGVLLLVFLGPSAVPAPTTAVPWSRVLALHPAGGKLAVAVLFAVPFALAWRRAEGLSPLSNEASALKKLGLVYLGPALLLVAQAVCLGIAEVASDWM